jgi:hypothetical protein
MTELLKLAQAVVGSASIDFVKQTMGEFKLLGSGPIDVLDQSINVSHEVEEKKVTTKVFFKLSGKNSAEDSDTALVINADFTTSYTIKEEFTEEQVDAFARVGGAYNCWPFWREFVHGTCCRMQIAPLTAPLMTAQQFANLVAEELVPNEEDDEIE